RPIDRGSCCAGLARCSSSAGCTGSATRSRGSPTIGGAIGSRIYSRCRRGRRFLPVSCFPWGFTTPLLFSEWPLFPSPDWQVVGLQNYAEVFSDPKLGGVLIKTVIWTVVSVAFHLMIGLLLAAALFRPIGGRTLYQLLLITPWAVPAYITALTWRGMFSY